MTDKKVLTFPSVDDLWAKHLAKDIEAVNLPAFVQAELKKRLPDAIRPLNDVRVTVDIPRALAGLSETQRAAFEQVIQQVRQQYADTFAVCIARVITRHVLENKKSPAERG